MAKIDKRTLRMEYSKIAPDNYAPDFDTQIRLNSESRTNAPLRL